MKFKFSELDRAVIASAQRDVPWMGNEAHVLARHELGEKMGLRKVKQGTPERPVKFSAKLDQTADLTRENMELMIAIVAGGGGALRGDVGPEVAELIKRMRAACPRETPTTAKADGKKGAAPPKP